MKKNELIILEDINANSLPEFQGWKEKQENLVKENPFIEVTDNKTYDEAKKRRTALVTGRTTIEKQDKMIASKIKQFRTKVSELSKELIAITQPHEEKQQEEVKRYEEIKAKEKAEKERIERERIEKIKNNISSYYIKWKSTIDTLELKNVETVKQEFEKSTIETKQYDEYELEFQEKVQILKQQLTEKEIYLLEKEDQRKERERIEAERKKLEEERKAAEDAARKEREAFEAKQKAAEEKARKEREAEEKKLAEERKKIEAERAKLEAEKKAKEEAERKAKEEEAKKAREEAERKRLEALKPEVEKLTTVINSIQINPRDIPELKEESAKKFLSNIQNKLNLLKSDLKSDLESLK